MNEKIKYTNSKFININKGFLFSIEPEIKNPDQILTKFRELCKSLDNIKDLFEISYNLNITRNNNKYAEQANINENMNNKNISLYYLPEFTNKSNILKEYHIIHLWENLPNVFKTNKASVIFSNKEKKNISDLINIFNNENQNIKFIFLIKTTMDEIFGFSMNQKIEYTNSKFININKGFLFSIEPEIKIFNISPDFTEILYVDNNKILLGKDFGESIALKISEDLSTGETHNGECFNNPCLINKEDGIFEIKYIEIIKLKS